MNDQPVELKLFTQSLPPHQDNLVALTANRIREMIESRAIAPGSRLPNEIELAEAMGVSRGTVRAALSLLQQQGLLWRRQGIGTFVSEMPMLENRLDLNFSYTALIESLGHRPGCRLIDCRALPAEREHASRLGVETGTLLVHIRRVRTADNQPVVASLDVFRASLLNQGSAAIDLETLKHLLCTKISLYRIFEEDLHQPIDYGITRLRPMVADARFIRQFELEIPKGSAVLYMEQLDYSRNREPLLLSYEYHLAEYSTFTIFRRR
ncbi:MAG: GntR family transcriptional regulator [Anaerolineales bacterium]|nr:GntR family transcriptional regulator [Anaerolineales bacterium]MDW8162520.1 GntR family transcriptional regulator [Anaerolineales bacterium]